MTEIPSSAIGALRALASPIRSFLSWATFNWRVSRDVHRRARDVQIRVGRKLIQKYLRRTGFRKRVADVNERSDLLASLNEYVDLPKRDADRVFELVVSATTMRLSPVHATMATGASVIDGVAARVESHENHRALWDGRLANLMPLRAEGAREAYALWSKMPTLLGLLDSPQRSELLRSWAQVLPTLLTDAPGAVFGWLADMASDSRLQGASAIFIDHALQTGVVPVGYWEVRLALLRGSNLSDPNTPDFVDAEHPYVRAALLENAGQYDEALAFIEAWNPVIADERATRRLLLATAALARNDRDLAIEIAQPLATETGSRAAAMIAARALVARETLSSSALHTGDLARALELLIATRDNYRRWELDTTEIVVLASSTARLLNDSNRALALTQIAPHGDANQLESEDIKVRGAAALLLAENGKLDAAMELQNEPNLDRWVASELRGILAYANADFPTAVQHFSDALIATPDFELKGRLAHRLAELGFTHPFVLEQNELGNAEFANELLLVAEANADEPGALTRLQASAHSSANLSISLSRYYARKGMPAEELTWLRNAAERLRDPDMWLAVAQGLHAQGQASDAARAARRALSTAHSAWGAQARAYRLLVECYASIGDWSQAVEAAENVVRVDTDETTAAWVLIECHYFAGDSSAALSVWETTAARQDPPDRNATLVWIALMQQFGDRVASLSALPAVAARWPEDEEVRRLIVGLLLLQGQMGNSQDGDATSENTIADHSALATLLPNYLRDFPNGAIRAISVDPDQPEGILDEISRVVGDRPGTSITDAQVFRGDFPLGVLTLTHGSTYAEAVISHAAGVRFATSVATEEQARAAAAVGQPVVIDVTALFMLSALPENARASLISAVSAISISAAQFVDAVRALESITRFGHAGPNLRQPAGPVSRRHQSSDRDTQDSDRERATKLVALMRPLTRRPTPATDLFKELAVQEEVWLAAGAVAGTSTSLWCDDAAFCQLAEYVGISTFSTPALVDTLEDQGSLSSQEAQAIRLELLRQRYVKIPFDLQLYTEAVGRGAEARDSVAAVLENIGAANADAVLDFFFTVMPSAAADGPPLERWMSACTRWLVRVSSDDEQRSANLRMLCVRIASSMWMLPQTFPYIDAGVSDGLDGLEGHDPLVDQIAALYAARRTAQTRQDAVTWVLDLIAGVDQPRRLRYTEFLLRP